MADESSSDIGESQKIEADLRALNVTLEQRVAERTAQLEDVNQALKDEIAGHKQAAEILKVRARQQLVVAELGHRALSGIDLPELMDEVVTRVAETLEIEYCKILELLPDENNFLVQAGLGWEKGVVGQAKVAAGYESQAGYTLRSNEPIIVTDLQAETRFVGMPILHDHSIVSGMTIIIHGREQPYGILGAHTAQRRVFTQDDANFLQSVANVLAAAIERRRVEDALQLSRDQLAVILQGVSEGITAQDSTGRVIYANDAAAFLLGYPSTQDLLNAPPQNVMQKFAILDESGEAFPIEKLPGQLALLGEPDPSAIIRLRDTNTSHERWSSVKARPVFNTMGGVELAVNVFQDITTLKRLERAQHILAEAGRVLAASIDYSTRLTNLAKMLISHLADWCVIDVIEEDQSIRRLAVTHVDPAKAELAHTLQHHYPPDRDVASGIPKALRTGQSELYPEITDDILNAWARDSEHLQIFRELGVSSAMIVPLIAWRQTLGTMTFFWAKPGWRYDNTDLELAEKLAYRGALAMENARLYSAAQRLNTELEQRVIERTAELQAANAKLRNEIAEHKRAEAAVRENQALFEALFESAPDATLLVDGEGHVIRVNRQMEAMFGYSREELLGEPVEILLPAPFQERHVKHRAVYYTEPQLRTMGAGLELYGRRKDGSEFPVDIMLNPLSMEDDIMVISVVRDITDRKQAVDQLMERERQLAEAQQIAHVGSWEWDIKKNKVIGSEELYRIYGLTPQDFKAYFEGFLEWVHASDRNRVRKIFEEAFDNHTPFNFEHRLKRPDGTVRILQARGKVVLDDAGRPIKMFGISQDITDRIKAEEALRESEARFRVIFEGAATGISLTDLEGRVFESNPALQRMLGYSRDELRQMSFTEFTHPADVQMDNILFQESMAGKRNQYQLEKRFVRKDGQIVWGHLTISLVRGSNGEPLFAIAMTKDISERKQIEAELVEVRHRLIDSREAERLHLAQELHDGPLQDLHGASFRLGEIEPILPDEASLGQLVATQATLQQVIQTLRAICGELRPPTLAPFGLEKAIRSHAEMFQKANPELNIELDLMPDGQSLPEQLRLALFRICQQSLNNVKQHAEATEVKIRFGLDSEQVFLEIKDNGCGFELPKRRVELAREGHLGLVGAAERAEAMGGQLKIVSTPDEGTLIKVVVPRLKK